SRYHPSSARSAADERAAERSGTSCSVPSYGSRVTAGCRVCLLGGHAWPARGARRRSAAFSGRMFGGRPTVGFRREADSLGIGPFRLLVPVNEFRPLDGID